MRGNVTISFITSILAIFLMLGAVPMIGQSADEDVMPVMIPYLPIRIDSNADFDAAHGVTNGTGIMADPWIIEGYDINASGYGYGIYIGNTTDCFIIRHCNIHDADGNYDSNAAISLYNSTYGRIEEITVINNHLGFNFEKSHNYTIWNATIESNDFGINIRNSSYNKIIECKIKNILGSTNGGIYGWNSHSNKIYTSNITDSHNDGIYFSQCNDSVIFDTIISNCLGFGVELDTCFNTNINNCNFTNTASSINLLNSDYSQIYHNNFFDTSPSPYANGTEFINNWDKGYPLGGNYWGDYLGLDVYSGPSQDQLGRDGIGDTNYSIPGSPGNLNVDYYPLMQPWDIGAPVDLSVSNQDITVSNTNPYLTEIVTIMAAIYNVHYAPISPVHNVDKDTYYETIQAGVDDADPWNTITVASGIYFENVEIFQPLTLKGEGRSNTTIYGGGNGNVLEITGLGINISSIRLLGPGSGYYNIRLFSSGFCTLDDIDAKFMYLTGSGWNTFSNSIFSGLCIRNSYNNTVSRNYISNNTGGQAISVMGDSRYNLITNNTIKDNSQCGIFFGGGSWNTVSYNTITNNREHGWDAGGVHFELAYNNTICNNILTDDYVGIQVNSGGGNVFFNNIISLNLYGATTGSNSFGENNVFFHNNFINNTQRPICNNDNTWDNGYPSGGNYYSDWSSPDINSGPNQDIPGSDGIVDIPRSIGGPGDNLDNYPFVEPLNFSAGVCSIPPSPSPLLNQEQDINATCTVSFYLDTPSTSYLLYEESNVVVPGGANTFVSTNWKANITGNHTIIVIITNVNPPDSDLSNNTAIIQIVVNDIITNNTATATGPQGAHHEPVINITYNWTGTPTAIELYYSINNGESWNYLGTDITVDGVYTWGPASNPAPKPSKYYWIANAKYGGDDVGIPSNGTAPEAGPFNWKTWDTCGSAPLPLFKGSSNWFSISVPLDFIGEVSSVFDDANWGDGGTTWDIIQWYDPTDHQNPWKSYSIYRPPVLNDNSIIDNTMGFWIHLTSNDGDGVLTVGSGTDPISSNIHLYAGWNFVGYPTQDGTITVGDAFWGTGADRVEVFDPAEPYRIREVGPSYIMRPGEGYWVHVPVDTVWIVDW